jgi:hypothetical protein
MAVAGLYRRVWNLGDLIVWRPGGLPLEELLFGFSFAMYWSSIYEDVTWRHGMGVVEHHRRSTTNGLGARLSPTRLSKN